MHSIALRASAPRRSAVSFWVEPKISRKSLVRNLPSFLAEIAAIVSTVVGSRNQSGLHSWVRRPPPNTILSASAACAPVEALGIVKPPRLILAAAARQFYSTQADLEGGRRDDAIRFHRARQSRRGAGVQSEARRL